MAVRKINNFGIFKNKVATDSTSLQEDLNKLDENEVLYVNDGFGVYSYERINGKIVKHQSDFSVIDSLDSDSSTSALSARQGKELFKAIQNNEGKSYTITSNPMAIIHSFNHKPSVSVINKEGELVVCTVKHLSNSSLYVKWNSNIDMNGGTIYLI